LKNYNGKLQIILYILK